MLAPLGSSARIVVARSRCWLQGGGLVPPRSPICGAHMEGLAASIIRKHSPNISGLQWATSSVVAITEPRAQNNLATCGDGFLCGVRTSSDILAINDTIKLEI